MRTFAEIDLSNTVVFILKLNDNETTEVNINPIFKTQENTFWVRCGLDDEGNLLRKIFPGFGDKYNSEKDYFYPPQPYASWSFDEQTATWSSPLPQPNDGKIYFWDESTLTWAEPNKTNQE